MSDMTTREAKLLVADAEAAINDILAKLEIDTGMVVQSITNVDLVIQTMSEPRPEWLRSVKLKMMPIPGTCWQGRAGSA